MTMATTVVKEVHELQMAGQIDAVGREVGVTGEMEGGLEMGCMVWKVRR